MERYKHMSSLDVYRAIIVTDTCASIQYNRKLKNQFYRAMF